MLIVLSPAKTLNLEPCASPFHTEPIFLTEAAQLNQTLKGFSTKRLSKAMRLSESLAKLNHQRNQDWTRPFTPQNAKPALHTFQGDAYQALHAQDFTKEELEFAQHHLRILSALYGVLRPMDLIQPYRLEMKTPLKMGKHQNLYQFWGHKIAQALHADLALLKKSDGVLLNLASQEYFKSIATESLEFPVVHLEFQQDKGEGYKTYGMLAKRARGLMARFLIKNRITSAEGVQAFQAEGYQYHAPLSTENHWVFAQAE